MRVDISFVGFDRYQGGNVYQGDNLSYEKVVEHLTLSEVVLYWLQLECAYKDTSYKTYKHTLITVLCFMLLESAGLADDLQKSLCLLI